MFNLIDYFQIFSELKIISFYHNCKENFIRNILIVKFPPNFNNRFSYFDCFIEKSKAKDEWAQDA